MSGKMVENDKVESDAEEHVHVESELKAMREYFANKGTSNKKMKEELAFLVLRMILSSPVTPSGINATAQFLSPFVKFHFNDKLDEILADISEIEVSKNNQGKNLMMKWDKIVEKLEMYLDDEENDEEENEKDDSE